MDNEQKVAETVEEKKIKLDPNNYLQLLVVKVGQPMAGLDTFQMFFKNGCGDLFCCIVGAEPTHTQFIARAFNRMVIPALAEPIKPKEGKQIDEKEEASPTTTPPELPAGENSPGISE